MDTLEADLSTTDTPSASLAKSIMDRLVKEGIFGENAAKRLQISMASGNMTQEDWQLSVELGMEEQENTE